MASASRAVRVRHPAAESPSRERLDGGYGRRVPDAVLLTLAWHRFTMPSTGSGDDLTAYLSIAAELAAGRVLDVGCGTGCLAVLLAENGCTVMGADPAGASLEVARSKDKTGTIAWVHGDAAQVPAFDADLGVMTGNVAQVFLTDAGWSQALRAIRAALRPRGYLVFETRRLECRAWQEWATGTSPVILDIPGSGPVEQHLEVTSVTPAIRLLPLHLPVPGRRRGHHLGLNPAVPQPRRGGIEPGRPGLPGPGRSASPRSPRPRVRVHNPAHNLNRPPRLGILPNVSWHRFVKHHPAHDTGTRHPGVSYRLCK
jgi:2-polyprenyl-3-methyl-5-hydroxy-6-metoxy-1,4-benzoquinol methylase